MTPVDAMQWITRNHCYPVAWHDRTEESTMPGYSVANTLTSTLTLEGRNGQAVTVQFDSNEAMSAFLIRVPMFAWEDPTPRMKLKPLPKRHLTAEQRAIVARCIATVKGASRA